MGPVHADPKSGGRTPGTRPSRQRPVLAKEDSDDIRLVDLVQKKRRRLTRSRLTLTDAEAVERAVFETLADAIPSKRGGRTAKEEAADDLRRDIFSKVDKGARCRFAKKCKMSRRQQRYVQTFCAHKVRVPRGRKRGWRKVHGDDIKRVLEQRSVESCRWSAATGKAARTLDASISALHRQEPELHERLSYRALLTAMRRGKAGMSRAKNRSDVCSVCACWKYKASKLVQTFYDDARKTMQGFDPDYWLLFEDLLPMRCAAPEAKDKAKQTDKASKQA